MFIESDRGAQECPKKYKKLYPSDSAKKNEKGLRPAPMLIFLKKIHQRRKWHINCIIFNKSDTLISFLLKKVCFVPQSGPFSILSFQAGSFLVPGDR